MTNRGPMVEEVSVEPKTKSVTLIVEGMTCSACQ
jgi:P-type Cu+ transporter